jgi:hypothetical protein
LRLPGTLPRPVAIRLAVCALSFSAVTGIDYVRLDRDRAEFTAGIDAVPERATLLPLLFEHRKTSDFQRQPHARLGYYTVAKSTSAPLVFGVERSYPITYRDFPPRALIPPALDRFAEKFGTPAQVCKLLRQFPIDAACTAAWRDVWNAFWQEARAALQPRADLGDSPGSSAESSRRVISAFSPRQPGDLRPPKVTQHAI